MNLSKDELREKIEFYYTTGFWNGLAIMALGSFIMNYLNWPTLLKFLTYFILSFTISFGVFSVSVIKKDKEIFR
jgi:hypothetical protein